MAYKPKHDCENTKVWVKDWMVFCLEHTWGSSEKSNTFFKKLFVKLDLNLSECNATETWLELLPHLERPPVSALFGVWGGGGDFFHMDNWSLKLIDFDLVLIMKPIEM